MKKTELLKVIANKVEMSQKDVDAVLRAFEDTVVETLTEDMDESVPVGSLGKFKVKEVPERRGTIQMGDRKGEEYFIQAHNEITFKMAKSAKLI